MKKSSWEDNIPLAVEIVDLMIDMISADAKRSYMEQRLAKLIASKSNTTNNDTTTGNY